jgi:hypothetical protein
VKTRAAGRFIHVLSVFAAAGLCTAVAGCSSGHPQPISNAELAQAESFPYYRIYWAGPHFAGAPLTAVDGQKSYNSEIGESVYYGDCAHSNGIFATGSCKLPLQVTTVIYRFHSNSSLGQQHNSVVRGVPATVYEEGRSIELYSGRVAIDIFSSDPALAMRAANELRSLNAPEPASAALPVPVYCPGLSGAIPPALRALLDKLPGDVCRITGERIRASRESAATR